MKVDTETRLHIVNLMDKQFDDDSTRAEYFKMLGARIDKGVLYDSKWDRQHVNRMIEEVKALTVAHGQKYAVVQENGKDVLVLSKTGEYSAFNRKVMIYEDSYDILIQAHRELHHLGNREIYTRLRRSWTYPSYFVKVLLEACNICKILRRMIFINNLKDEERKESWRVRMLDLNEKCPYIETPKYILICEDVATEFLMLRPLNDQNVDSIAEELLKVFHQFGAPKKLLASPVFIYSYLGKALKAISKMDRQLVINIPTDNGDSTTGIQDCDIIETLQAWIDEVEATNYPIDCELGCHVVQRKLNTRLRVSNTSVSKRYRTFVPHNLFMKHVITIELWDDNVIIRTVVHEPQKRKKENSLNAPTKKRIKKSVKNNQSDSSDDDSDLIKLNL